MITGARVAASPRFVICAICVICGFHLPTSGADDSVVGSPHDLSVFSPQPIRSLREEEVCIFCHVPHTTQPQQALWRRANPELYYRIYQSSTTDARIDQPSGVSKMCLSCHDGLMALGMTGDLTNPREVGARRDSRTRDSRTSGGAVMTRRFLPPGDTNLTNDLRDDHPIGFRYDRALFRRDPQVRPPDQVSRTLPLGKHNEVHCTACHDPHNNRLGDFLRIPDRQSALCLACHDLTHWEISAHATSLKPTTGRRVDPSERLKYNSVAENGCASCHKIHTAPHAERLLRFVHDEDNCLNCHDGSVAFTDILSQIRRTSGHRGDRFAAGAQTITRSDIHDPTEDPRTMRGHVTCVDCHNPHAVGKSPPVALRTATPALAEGAIRGAPGVEAGGRAIERARFAYEICLRCHADNPRRVRSGIARQVSETNTRLEFHIFNASFHPVFGPRRNPDVVSLLPPHRVGATITCTDCHSSDDSPVAGGAGPAGPHGSRFDPLLANRYDTRDFTIESAQTYALCYRCHDRTSILADQSFSLHRLHVVVARTPCSACHDPHGVRPGAALSGANTNLINFDLSITRPVRTGAGLEPVRYVDTGRFSGACTLTCHGVDHIRLEYGPGAAPASARRTAR